MDDGELEIVAKLRQVDVLVWQAGTWWTQSVSHR
jgi:hypothetical protein